MSESIQVYEKFYQKGLKSKEKKNYDDSIKFFDLALKAYPSNAVFVYDQLADVYADMKQNDKAIELYRKCIEIKPDVQSFYVNLSAILVYSSSFNEIIELTTKAIELNPHSEDNDLAYQLKGMALSQLKRDDEAIKCLDIAIQMNPLNPLVYGYKATALMNKQSYREALNYFNFSNKMIPNDSTTIFDMGFCLLNLKQYDDSLKYLDMAFRLDPTPKERYYKCKADCYFYMSNFKDSMSFYTKACELRPENITYHLSKGKVLFLMQNYAEAIKCFDSVLKLESDNCESHDFKGNCLLKLKKYAEALDEYLAAHKIDPQNQVYLNHVNMAKANLK